MLGNQQEPYPFSSRPLSGPGSDQPALTPQHQLPIFSAPTDIEAIRTRFQMALRDADGLSIWLAAHMRDDLHALFGMIDGLLAVAEGGSADVRQ